ncbi:hypothetical protein B0J14DRAFT_648242 [Halenospora varia]|nr:hypothetical protein B0J14DRAFT_648242 [Halenospora varia]
MPYSISTRSAGPYPSNSAGLGGVPTVATDVPVCAIFTVLYLSLAATNSTIFRRNRKNQHKFILSVLLTGFCMARVGTLVLRIAWATRQHNIRLAIAAQIFVNAGILVVYIVNLVPVETSDHTQRAVIKSKGYILSQVPSVRSDDRQNVNITFTSKSSAWCLGDKMEWTLQASAKSIREHDIVCLLQGASKPTIIRLCKDRFAIIVIAVTPLKESGSFKQLELSKLITYFPCDFLLVWDWEQLQGESQVREESKNWVSVRGQTSNNLKEWFLY